MAKSARSPGKGKAKSTKPKSRRAAKPAQAAKSAAGRKRKSPTTKKTPSKKATTKRSTKARPRATNRSTSKRSASAAKAPAKRSTRSRKTKSAGYVATFDGWCKDCTAKLQELIHEYSSKPKRRSKSRRSHQPETTPQWLASGARQLGLGLRRGAELANPRKFINGTGEKIRHIKFNHVTDFCKKEWNELSVLASKINKSANPPRRRSTKRTRK